MYGRGEILRDRDCTRTECPAQTIFNLVFGLVDPDGEMEAAFGPGILEDFLDQGGLSQATHPHEADDGAPAAPQKQIQDGLLLVHHAHHIGVGGVQNRASPPRGFLVNVVLPFVTRGEISDSVHLPALPDVIDPLHEQLDLFAEVVAVVVGDEFLPPHFTRT